MLLEDWLDDLCVRFIINLPGDDLSSVERICFQVEEAQWYYEDFIRPLDPSLPSLSLRNFCLRIFAHCPLLSAFSEGDHMRAFEEFLTYKKRIPVRGAIMLNAEMDSLVLVKGWKKGANWSFPRGKINKDEDDLICAIREVYEETGYELQLAGLVPPNREVKHITLPLRDQDMRLYVFRDVPMDTHFEPRTRKEISKIQWWRISDLPGFRKKGQQNTENGAINANKFYMVAPFLRDLRKWILEQKQQDSKRHSNNQYLSAAMSHDEILTEEDFAAESAHEPIHDSIPTPRIDTLEGATAALRNLLKVQPPTEGLQADAIKAPIARDSGSELLALLQGKGPASNQHGSSNVPPRILYENNYSQTSAPETPQHINYSRPPPFSSMPPPPPFTTQPPPGSFSYQERRGQNSYYPDSIAAFQQSQIHNQHHPSRPPHLYQSPHLIHPQPLPPHVQRAVFTGGPVHSPMMPQPTQQYIPQHNGNVPVHNPQFPNVHAPMVPDVQRTSPSKLTSHSLSLLDAFKSPRQPAASTANHDLPSRRYEQDPKQALPPPPQELPAEMLRPQPVDLLSLFKAKETPIPSTSAHNPPKNTTEAHKSTLLGLFKSPVQPNFPTRMSATALPTSVMPSAVELSATEPVFSIAEVRPVEHKDKSAAVSQMHPELSLPFGAMSLLTRPQPATESSNRERNGKPNESRPVKKPAAKKHAAERKPQPKPSPPKPFQPQILKRPQPGAPNTAGVSASPLLFAARPVQASPIADVTSASPLSFAPLPTLESVRAKIQPSSSPMSFSSLPRQQSLDRRAPQPVDHKQNLLSLFGKAPSPQASLSRLTTEMMSPLERIEPVLNVSGRSRVGSLASEEPRRSSQAPMSPADKNFLLSYLDGVAKGVKR